MAIEQVAKTVLAPIQAGRAFIDNLANKAIVKPKHAHGIGGFVFDYDGETEVNLQADITDHYAEDGSFFHDHIALRPPRIRMRGIVSELVLKKKEGLVGALSQIQNGLTIVPAYLGSYTPSQLKVLQGALTKAQSIVNSIDQTIARVQNLAGIIGGFFGSSPAPTKQEKAFGILKAMMETKVPVTVETPYRYYDSMAIESLSFIQDADTKTMSEIVIVLKQVRFVESRTIQKDPSTNPYFAQNQSQINKGTTQGKTVDESLLHKGLSFFLPAQ